MNDSDFDSDFEDKNLKINNNNNNDDENIDKENENLIKQVNQFLKEKTLVFNGFRDLDGEEIVDDEDENADKTPDYVKKELVEAVAEGDLFKVDELLRMPDVDINTKYFSENLLMIAIKNKQEKMGEYLIANGIDFKYQTKFYEFGDGITKKSPFNYFLCSARQMAYDRNMTKLVDLIDIFDKNTDRRIRNYLAKRYLKENIIKKNKENINNNCNSYFYKNPLENSDDDVFNRDNVVNYLLSDEANLLQLKHQQEKEMIEAARLEQEEIEKESKKKTTNLKINNSVDMIEVNRPDDDNNTITESSLSYISNETLEKSGYFPIRKYRKVDSLEKQLMNEINENSLNKNSFEIENEFFKKKSLQYKGYKINFYITQRPDPLSLAPESAKHGSLLEDFYDKIYISKLSRYSKLDKRNRLNETPFSNNNSSLSNRRVSSSRTESKRSSLNYSPAFIPESVLSYRNEEKYFEKKFDNKILPVLTNSKEINKIKNHNYLNELSKRTSAKDVVIEGMKKYTEPLFPLNSESSEIIYGEKKFDKKIQAKTRVNSNSLENNNFSNQIDQMDNNRSSSDSKKVSFKLELNEASILSGLSSNNLNRFSSMSLRPGSKKPAQFKHDRTQKTQNQIFNSYMNSLKKSGLINKNCLPIINKKSIRNSNSNNNNNKSSNALIQTK